MPEDSVVPYLSKKIDREVFRPDNLNGYFSFRDLSDSYNHLIESICNGNRIASERYLGDCAARLASITFKSLSIYITDILEESDRKEGLRREEIKDWADELLICNALMNIKFDTEYPASRVFFKEMSGTGTRERELSYIAMENARFREKNL